MGDNEYSISLIFNQPSFCIGEELTGSPSSDSCAASIGSAPLLRVRLKSSNAYDSSGNQN